jgi:ABC-type Fe3+/spermidine/putrescine transport system ATPase subunit
MKDGRLMQVGSPRTIYARPANPFVADFVGTTNFFHGVVGAAENGGARVRVDSELGVVDAVASESLGAGDRVVLTVRPEDVELSETPSSGLSNTWTAVVDQKIFLGESIDFRV